MAALASISKHVLPPQRRLSEHVAHSIQDDLVQHRRTAGKQLPTEPELAAQYDLSRTVIRKAGRLLMERGLVDISPGRGMVVADFDGATIARQCALMFEIKNARFAELMEMRLVLEVGMTEYAEQRLTQEDLDRMRESLAAFSDPNLTHELALEYDLLFHASVAAAAHNTFFQYIVNPINEYLRSKYQVSLGYEAARQRMLLEHMAITEAISQGDAQRAGDQARQHLLRILETREEPGPEHGTL